MSVSFQSYYKTIQLISHDSLVKAWTTDGWWGEWVIAGNELSHQSWNKMCNKV